MISKVLAVCLLACALSVLFLGTWWVVAVTLAAGREEPGFEPIIDTGFPFYFISISVLLGIAAFFALPGALLWRWRS